MLLNSYVVVSVCAQQIPISDEQLNATYLRAQWALENVQGKSPSNWLSLFIIRTITAIHFFPDMTESRGPQATRVQSNPKSSHDKNTSAERVRDLLNPLWLGWQWSICAMFCCLVNTRCYVLVLVFIFIISLLSDCLLDFSSSLSSFFFFFCAVCLCSSVLHLSTGLQ